MKRVLLLFFLCSLPSLLFAQYAIDFEIGSDHPQLGPFYFFGPQAIAVTSDGTQYVVDTYNDRIQVFNAEGKLVNKFGRRGTGNGEFISPTSIALDAAGKIYVTDPFNNRIQVFNNDGSFNRKFGSFGNSDGEFWAPIGIAVLSTGDVVVADQDLNRVQVFTNTGTFLRKFGSSGSGDGQFSDPVSVAVNSSDEILICDQGNSRIQVFNTSGVFQRKFGTYGSADGQFMNPLGVAVDGSGNVYISDRGNHRIQVVSSTGTFIRKFGSNGTANGQFVYPKRLAVDTNGTIYVADGDNNRIQVFTNTGTFTKSYGQLGNADAYFTEPTKAAYANNRIYIVDNEEKGFYILDGSGNLIRKVTTFTGDRGHFIGPYGIALDAAGNIYITDYQEIQVFTSAGDYLRTIAASTSGGGVLSYPVDIALDEDNRIYVSDNNTVQVFTNAGAFLFAIGTQGTGNGQFNGQPTGLDYRDGKLYVVDNGNNRVQIFDKTGAFLSKFGSNGSGDGQFQTATDITVTSTGNMYVLETSRVQLFDANGVFISKFGTSGSGIGQLIGGSGITMKGSSALLVVEGFDSGNSRIQEFSTLGTPNRIFGNKGTGDGQFSTNNFGKVQMDASGNIYVASGTRIQVFDSTGKYIRSIGSSGTGDGQFNGLNGIVLGPDGKIYTSEWQNQRVQVFNNDGTFVRKFGTVGSGNGQLNFPVDLSLDADGNIYVAERFNYRVSVFTNAGVFLRKFGSNGSADGQFSLIYGIHVRGNFVYVLDGSLHKFDLDGNFIARYYNLTTDLDFDADGNGYLARTTTPQLLTPTLGFAGTIGTVRQGNGIAVSADGQRIAVSDNLSHRVVVYKFTTKQNQTISLTPTAVKSVNSSAYTLTPKTSADFSVVYTSSNPLVATVSGYTVTIVGAGETTITGSHPGNAFYNAAPSVNHVLTVNKLYQFITFSGTMPAKTTLSAPFTVDATASTGLPVTFSSSNLAVATVSGNTITIVGGGQTTITASQAGDATYMATSATQTLNVSKVAQTITFPTIASAFLTDAPFTLSATSSSGLPVSYASSAPAVASVDGATVTVHAIGTTTITASHAGNNIYLPATAVTQSLLVQGRILELTGDLEFSDAVQETSTVTKSYVIKNKGNISLEISNITFPEFFNTPTKSLTIPANSFITIPITFSPPRIDFFEGDVVITSNAHEGNNVFRVSATNVVTDLEVSSSDQVAVSPNPSSGVYRIAMREHPVMLTLINQTGKEIKNDERLKAITPTEYRLNITDLSAGVYLLKVEFATRSMMLRVVKY